DLEHIDGQFFRGFPITDNAHDQGEHNPMRLGVERMQRSLIAGGDGLNHANRDRLGDGRLRLLAKEQIAQRVAAVALIIAWLRSYIHNPGIMTSLVVPVKFGGLTLALSRPPTVRELEPV